MSWFSREKTVDSQNEQQPKKITPKFENPAIKLRQEINKAHLPNETKLALIDECDRLEITERTSPEFAISSNYIDFVLSLPWENTTKDDLNLARAKEILDARHFGLTNVKERILEFLAVKKLRSQHHPKVLIVDDEEIARENLKIIFEKENFDVETAPNGTYALQSMEIHPADVVITDLKMQGMDGIELLQEVRHRWPDTGVIMLTGHGTVQTAVEAMQLGADQYMPKPVNLTKLRSHVLSLLNRNLRVQHLKGPVLCFTGPPGTGKTSIGQAIAEAMGRKFIRISLAGLRDEAELRGHRKTYVGAMAGRILQSIQKCEVRNPVIMLDEMDKVIQSFKGDATSVLLEILDPEQNSEFIDNYLGLPFDLSGAMFIATVNIPDRLPAPLRDRMEEIEFPSYTVNEKSQIVSRFILRNQLKNHGLDEDFIDIHPDAIRRIILDYSREAGLRGLEKQIAALCRKLARITLENGQDKLIEVSAADIPRIMGPVPHFRTSARLDAKVGVATGMVWTENGGEIIFVEVAKMVGNKHLILTGSLGNVLQESARTALSFIRSNADKFNIKPDFFETADIHVHIPAGGITKEGPSAGLTIATAMLSQLTGKALRQDTASTGELSLLGEILPVAGIREKIMAAARSGITKVIIPEQCAPSIAKIDPEVTKKVEIVLVKNFEEVIEAAFI